MGKMVSIICSSWNGTVVSRVRFFCFLSGRHRPPLLGCSNFTVAIWFCDLNQTCVTFTFRDTSGPPLLDSPKKVEPSTSWNENCLLWKKCPFTSRQNRSDGQAAAVASTPTAMGKHAWIPANRCKNIRHFTLMCAHSKLICNVFFSSDPTYEYVRIGKRLRHPLRHCTRHLLEGRPSPQGGYRPIQSCP